MVSFLALSLSSAVCLETYGRSTDRNKKGGDVQSTYRSIDQRNKRAGRDGESKKMSEGMDGWLKTTASPRKKDRKEVKNFPQVSLMPSPPPHLLRNSH
mmetsp:Transcript_3467/g.7193  ORF Transcript_3467/g.7193 Transcript_3467/m.7193 type:complete len:98 (-) Transcript_3467:34-327(-)